MTTSLRDEKDLPHGLTSLETLMGERGLRERIGLCLHLQAAARRPVEDPAECSRKVLRAAFEALRRAALAGLGVVTLPKFYVAGDIARGNLVELLADFPLTPLGVFAVHAKGKLVPAKVRQFIEHLVRRLRMEKLD